MIWLSVNFDCLIQNLLRWIHCFKSEPTSQTHGYAALMHPRLGLLHGVFTIVEDARSQHRVRPADAYAVGQVVEVAHAA
jgi:hypothetical protein